MPGKGRLFLQGHHLVLITALSIEYISSNRGEVTHSLIREHGVLIEIGYPSPDPPVHNARVGDACGNVFDAALLGRAKVSVSSSIHAAAAARHRVVSSDGKLSLLRAT